MINRQGFITGKLFIVLIFSRKKYIRLKYQTKEIYSLYYLIIKDILAILGLFSNKKFNIASLFFADNNSLINLGIDVVRFGNNISYKKI